MVLPATLSAKNLLAGAFDVKPPVVKSREDSHVTTYVSQITPDGNMGDLWFDTSKKEGIEIFRHNGTKWENISEQ